MGDPENQLREVTVVVLNYNGRNLLETALPSIYEQSYKGFSVTVVDNGSTDGSAAYLAAEWPDVDVLALEHNVGVTGAMNRGAAAAQTEFVALLNNDLELDSDCLAELVRALKEHPDAASAGAKLLDYERRDVLDGAGDQITWSGMCTRRGHGEPDRGQYDEPQEVFSACGGAALYRTEAFRTVGPFDEDFHAYLEDADWGFRAQLAGYTCRYVPSAVVYHMGSATLGPLNDFSLYHLWRNAIWLVLKNYPAAALARHAHRVLGYQLLVLAQSVRRRRARLFLKAWIGALKELPTVLRKRRRIQKRRAVDSRRLGAVVSRVPRAVAG